MMKEKFQKNSFKKYILICFVYANNVYYNMQRSYNFLCFSKIKIIVISIKNLPKGYTVGMTLDIDEGSLWYDKVLTSLHLHTHRIVK